MRTALTKRGVAVIVIPGDVALRECSAPALSLGIETSASLLFHRTTNFAMPPRFLTTRKITILGGVGCEGAHAELITAAERLKAPIVHALRARNLLLGFSSGCHAMMNCDALLMLGTDLPYQQFYPRSLKIIQVDRLGEQIGRRTPVDLGLIGNVRDTLERLIPLIESRTDRTYSIMTPGACRQSVDSLWIQGVMNSRSSLAYPLVTIHHLALDANPSSFYSLRIFDALAHLANPLAVTKRTLCAATNPCYLSSNLPSRSALTQLPLTEVSTLLDQKIPGNHAWH